ncbi:helix-turn-helix transcriptional regulator [Actinomadura miaoliensis]|uniref:AraC family transcriptional regulator n=1 Tax=Actinomadura miaoliensis TaxID=430685 RepID=A0ABP7VJF3_9ACTN
MQIHSMADAGPGRCEAVTGRPHPRLRPYVVGYSGFRTTGDGPVRRTILPLNFTTLIVDVARPVRLVTGPRGMPVLDDPAPWRHGVTVGLTPVGVAALLGVPMGELGGATVDLADLLGDRAELLAERLGEAPHWRARFAVLDESFTAWLRPPRRTDDLVTHAWRRLQSERLLVGGLAAELGVSRRRLEVGFRRHVGLTPKTVARVARFQRAVWALSAPAATLGAAVACGYADQPHLTREVRAMSGMTPAALFAFVQDIARRRDYRPAP